jgi:tRNA/tmRNA/rRNA uracil-C5-methylase (TrmA/RlmC/RlmD family)
MSKFLNELELLIKEENLSLYDFKSQKGDLRYIVLREAKFTDETQVNLIINKLDKEIELNKYFTATSIYHSENSTLTDISSGEIKKHWGEEYFKEKILGIEYLIHPDAFFQNNSFQFENVLKRIGELSISNKVLDAYSGIGSIGIYLAKLGKTVTGFDNNAFSIKMARLNVEHNKIDASYYVQDDKNYSDSFSGFGTIVVDPPRTGLHPSFKSKLLFSNVPQIIYLSCNPKSLKVDLDFLKERYDVKEIIGYDMFPHTPHIELLVNLELR